MYTNRVVIKFLRAVVKIAVFRNGLKYQTRNRLVKIKIVLQVFRIRKMNTRNVITGQFVHSFRETVVNTIIIVLRSRSARQFYGITTALLDFRSGAEKPRGSYITVFVPRIFFYYYPARTTFRAGILVQKFRSYTYMQIKKKKKKIASTRHSRYSEKAKRSLC